jgi:signal peptidase I
MKTKFLIPIVLVTLFVGSIPTLLSTIINKENFETRYIASGGMEPTLHINDRVFFDKIKI